MADVREELLRKFLEAFAQRDLDAVVELMHPEIEIVALVSAFEGAFSGHDGVRRWFEALTSLAPDLWFEVEDMRTFDADGMILLGRQGGSSDLEGVPLEVPLAMVGRVRDGLIWRAHAYRTHAEALEAAGLE